MCHSKRRIARIAGGQIERPSFFSSAMRGISLGLGFGFGFGGNKVPTFNSKESSPSLFSIVNSGHSSHLFSLPILPSDIYL